MRADLYAELDVSPTATAEEIKAAGRARAKQTHPDAGGSAEAFNRVQRALAVLKDPERRARYDQTGDAEQPVGGEAWEIREAYTVVANLIRHSIRGERVQGQHVIADPDVNNIQVLVANAISTIIRQFEGEQSGINGEVKRAKIMLRRFTMKPGKLDQDIMTSILEGEVREAEERLGIVEMKIRVHQKAAAVIAAYHYQHDVQMQAPQHPFGALYRQGGLSNYFGT